MEKIFDVSHDLSLFHIDKLYGYVKTEVFAITLNSMYIQKKKKTAIY